MSLPGFTWLVTRNGLDIRSATNRSQDFTLT